MSGGKPSDRRRENTGYRFPKTRRVTSGDDFTRIIQRGRVAADGTLVVNALPREGRGAPEGDSRVEAAGRLGVTIPKKAGGAVVRNRWKRLIRESYRLQQQELPPGFDFVVRPRRGAVASFPDIYRSLRRLAHRAASGGRN